MKLQSSRFRALHSETQKSGSQEAERCTPMKANPGRHMPRRCYLPTILFLSFLFSNLSGSSGCFAQDTDWYQMGLRDSRQGNVQAAIKHFQRSLAQNPDQPRVILALARAYRDDGKAHEAESCYQRVLAFNANDFDATFELAQVLSWKKNTQEKALRLFKQAAILRPSYSEVARQIALLESWNIKTRPQAIADFKQYTTQHPEDFEAVLTLARLLEWAHQYKESSQYFARCTAMRPNDFKVQNEAKEVASAAIGYQPSVQGHVGSFAKVPVDPYRAGVENFNKKFYAAAIKDLRRAIKDSNHTREASMLLASALKINGDTKQAIVAYRRALELSPNDITAKANLAEMLSWHEATRQESVSLLQDVVKASPGDLAIQRKLGIIASWSPKTREIAIENLLPVANACPADAEVRLILARLYDLPETWSYSMRYYRQYLSLVPNDLKARLEFALLLSYQPAERVGALSELGKVLAEHPDDKVALLAHAKTLYRLKDYASAQPELEKLLSIYPEDSSISIAYADTLCKTGHNQQADKQYDLILKHPPVLQSDLLGALSNYSMCLAEQDRLEDALKICRRILSTPGVSTFLQVEAFLRIGDIDTRKTLWADSEDAARNALSLQPGNPEALLMLAGSLLAQSKITEAKEALNNIPSANRETDPYIQIVARLNIANKDFATAAVQLSGQLAKDPRNLEIASMLADCYLALHDYQKAQTLLQEELTFAPRDNRLRFALAKCFMYEGRNDEALTFVAQIANSSDVSSAEILRLAQETSGVELLRPLSVALLRNLLARQSDNKPAALMLAHMLSWSEGTRPEAIQLYRQYLSQNDDAVIRADLAEVLSWSNDRRESLKLYEALLATSPGDRRLLMRMAQVLSWNGNLEKALKIYREILSKEPGNEEALLGTAQCQEWSGYNLAAEKILSSLASRQSNNPVNASSAARFINKPEAADFSRSLSVAIALERALNFRQMGRYDRAAQMLSQFYDLNTPVVREPREL